MKRASEILETMNMPTSLLIKEIEPPPDTCQFCGQELPYKPLQHPFKSTVIRWIEPDRCKCVEAKNRWLIVDEKEQAERQKEWEEHEAMQQMQKIYKLFSRSNLGRRFIDRTFENFKTTKGNEEAFKACLDYAQNFREYAKNGEGLLLIGTVGTGKTHLTASIANQLINQLTPVIFGNITSLLGRIKETYSGDGKEHEIIESLTTADLLIIDDLGKENSTQWVLEKLYSIINARYEDYKPIIVTTNLNPKELENKIGAATWSRIIEMCNGIQMNGADYRKKKLGQP